MDQVVFFTFLISIMTLSVCVWRWLQSSKDAKPSSTGTRRDLSSQDTNKGDTITRVPSAQTSKVSLVASTGDNSTTEDSTDSTTDSEVLRVNLESLMNEMEVGSSTLDYEDIEQFQNEAKESLKKANGSLRKLFKDAINKNGIQGMHDVLKHELNRWKDVKLNIAITGAAGTGKSSLINTLRGIRPSHPLAAKVGVDETTLQPTPYPHPQYDNVVYWDLPGVGTLKFKKDTYVEKTDLDKYDLFIIVGCGRFTENDAWLASEVFKIDRQVYIVRTKIDIDMQNEMSDYAERFQKKVVMEKIRQSTTANMEKLADEMHLKKAVVEKIPIFLISTKLHDVKKYDFEDLQKTMTDEIPDIKKEAMVMALSTLTLSAIDEKMKVIKERFQKMWGAITVALCIPGINILSLFFVEGILDNEMNMYRQQLGIDDESIIQRNIDVNNLDLQMTPTSKSKQFFNTRYVLKNILFKHRTHNRLDAIFFAMESDAIKIHEYLNRHLVNKDLV